ncbi:MAG: hypothetical protein K8F52_01225 [Candidatus Scalindua rubra]|nr:hypothetical protein [Candidatus Scalindua rubra]
MNFSYAVESVQDIHIRGIIIGSKNVPMVVIEDPFSGSINTYQLHDKLNDFEIVEIKKKEGILLKKGEKTAWVLLSTQDSFWNKDKLKSEGKNKVQSRDLKLHAFLKDQIDTENIKIKSRSGEEMKSNKPGVMVTEIKEESFLSVMGMEAGDVLLRFNQSNINNPEDLGKAVEKIINPELGDSAINNIMISFKKDGKFKTSYGKVQ